MDYTSLYLPPETEIVVMENDPDLSPITIPMPEPPPMSEMLNYGLHPDEQYWKRFAVPAKLIELEKNREMGYRQKVEYLEANQAYYQKEIEWIFQDIKYSREGLWIMIRGRGYYVPPRHYDFLQWWKIDNKFVKFRNRDRKYYLFSRFVDNDPNCIGFNYPKHRREGATNREENETLFTAMETPFANFGMQSKDETHAMVIHQQMIDHAWRYYVPFWRKPIYNEANNDMTSLCFTEPTAKSKENHGKVTLNTIIDFRDSNEKAYDGLKLRKIYNDEIGKTVEVDVKRRFDIQRQCCSDGSTIIGKIHNTSTVDEMEKGGGKNFKKLCDQSHYHKKNEKTGRTTSWLYNFFQPAYEGFGGDMPEYFQKKYGCTSWIDIYGFDVIDPETGRPAAEEYHNAQLSEYKAVGDIDGFIEYCRQFPLRWRDCWKARSNENNFNLEIIEDRLEEFRYGNPHIQTGYFRWVDNIVDGTVEWVPDPNGKFKISYQFSDPKDSNKFFYQDGLKRPGNTSLFVAGGDPFKFKRTKSGKKSKGGGAVFMKHNVIMDPPWKDIRDWVSNRFVCTYSNRPADKKIYGEDMLMMCVYFGCEMFPEINVEFLWDYFTDRGYGGYLLYQFDPKKDLASVSPGAQTTTKVIEDIFREYQYYIQNHGSRECHDDLLEQCKDIEDDMGDFDLFTAGGYALLGAKKISYQEQSTQKTDVESYFPTYYFDNLDP